MKSLFHLLGTVADGPAKILILTVPLLFVLGTSNLPSVDRDDKSETAKPKIEDFAWLAGEWRGEGFGGTCEEIWSHPLAGTMVGTFRLVKDDAVVFYEIMVLGPDKEGFALKVKHFSQEFVAWEDKETAVRFPFQSVKNGDARFSGLTLARQKNQLEIKVRMRESDGSTHWEPIQLKRHTPSRSKN